MGKDIIKASVNVIIFAVIIGVIFTLIFTNTSLATIIDTDTYSQAIPFNLALTGNNPQTLINFSNGTTVGSVTIPATNYTDNLTNGIFTVLDNSSFGGTPTLTYSDRHANFIGGASATLVSLVTVFFAIMFVMVFVRKSGQGK